MHLRGRMEIPGRRFQIHNNGLVTECPANSGNASVTGVQANHTTGHARSSLCRSCKQRFLHCHAGGSWLGLLWGLGHKQGEVVWCRSTGHCARWEESVELRDTRPAYTALRASAWRPEKKCLGLGNM